MIDALILIPLLSALALFALPDHARKRASWIAGAGMLAAFAIALQLAEPVLAGQVPRSFEPWLPGLGLSWHLRIDGLAWLFVLLVSGIGALVVLYAHYYLGRDEPMPRFFAYLMLFTAAMLGVVTSGNLLLLLVFWELTSLTSFLLIGFWRGEAEARRGARMALAITGLGGLALLGGVLLLGHIAGSFELDAVFAAHDRIVAHAWYPYALALVLLGAFTKSAQFPFHVWLPNAMAAPTPVSAFLHSATMVKAGVFLLARLYPALAGTELWFVLVTSIGLITLVSGAYIAIFQHDLKGLLAYSTISHLGLITLLLGLETPLTVVAAVFHIINHATFKASLFMAAGIIDHESGTRDMRRLKGLMKYMPWTGSLAIVASSAMAGVPLLNGFLSKEMFFAETLALDAHAWFEWVVPVGAVVAGVFAVAYSTRFIHDVFFGTALCASPKTPHEPPRFMKVPVEVLVVLCVAVGTFPAYTVAPILDIAARAAAGGELPAYSLAIWHGFNLPLLMSVLALVGGLLLYFGLGRFVGLHRLDPQPIARSVYEATLGALLAGARGIWRWLGANALSPHVAIWALALALLGSSAWWSTSVALGDERSAAPPLAGLLCLLLLGFVVLLLRYYRQRLAALALVGAIGLWVCVVLVLLSAPDLALTQLLVEVASALLLLLALRHLPHRSADPPSQRWLHGAIALLAGAVVAGLCYAVLSWPSASVSQFYLDNAVAAAGGTNAVNVIIVDFRGLDTLGEMTVFAIAALIVHALLSNENRRAEARGDELSRPMLLRLAAGALLPFALLISLYLLIRGHNQPGGGFIAGLIAACAFGLNAMAQGRAALWQARPWVVVIAIGLLLGVATGAAALLVDYPLLTSYYQYWKLPILEKVPLASVFLFDFGVFLVVTAGTVLVFLAIAQSQFARRGERR
jgi:multicomponent K+:H+ antiporter subunit A